MRLCSVRTCYSAGATTHRFPNPEKYPLRFSEWLKRADNSQLLSMEKWKVYNQYTVCSKHFEESDFGPNRKLKNIAIPTLCLPSVHLSLNEPLLQSPETSASTSEIRNNEFLNLEPTKYIRNLSPVAQHFHKSSLKYKKAAYASKRRAIFYRKQLKLAQNFVNHLEGSVLGNDAINFCLGQLKKRNIKPKGRRYTTNEKILALALYKQSGRAYSKLRQLFALPTRQTIMEMLNEVPINAGFNKLLFDNLKDATSKLKSLDKQCVLVFDEMAIMPHIDYDKNADRFYGFETHSTSLKIADHVLVFCIRGCFKKWQQSIYFSFSSSSTKSQVLAKFLKLLIAEIQNCGLKIVATICDQGCTNQAAINSLLTESRKIYISKELQIKRRIIIQNQEIVPLFDTPHLIKGIRNNLLTKDLVWELDNETSIKAEWKHILQAYLSDRPSGELRALPKITDLHVIAEKIPKMKVSYATQVFSHSMAAAIILMVKSGDLSEDAVETAKVIKFFDKLYDSVNRGTLRPRYGKPYSGGVSRKSGHVEFWKESICHLKTMYFVDKSGKKSVPPSLKNWINNLEGFLDLFEMLVENGQCNFFYLGDLTKT